MCSISWTMRFIHLRSFIECVFHCLLTPRQTASITVRLFNLKVIYWKNNRGRITVFQLSSAHYNDVIMSTIASQITSPTIVYWTVYSGTECSTSLAFVRGIHRWPVNSPHTGPVTRKMFPFDDVIMNMPVVWFRPYCRCSEAGDV